MLINIKTNHNELKNKSIHHILVLIKTLCIDAIFKITSNKSKYSINFILFILNINKIKCIIIFYAYIIKTSYNN